MSIIKIAKHYCRDNRVQFMLRKGTSQVVFSEQGILYLKVPFSKDETLSIHKYSNDKDRNYFPYHDRPVSTRQHNHIFDCDTIYVELTGAQEHSAFNFRLFKKLPSGDALLETLGIDSFESDNTTYTFNALEVQKYLERQPEEDARFIFDMWDAVNGEYGLLYVNANDCEYKFNNFYIPLDNESIVKRYNQKIEPFDITMPNLFYDEELEAEQREISAEIQRIHDERAWEKKSIDEIEEFSLTGKGFIQVSQPYMVVVKDGAIMVKNFDIRFKREDEFLVKEKTYHISKEKFKIARHINSKEIDYGGDPTYIKTEYPPPKEEENQRKTLLPHWLRQ